MYIHGENKNDLIITGTSFYQKWYYPTKRTMVIVSKKERAVFEPLNIVLKPFHKASLLSCHLTKSWCSWKTKSGNKIK